jgi:hypothetical protein
MIFGSRPFFRRMTCGSCAFAMRTLFGPWGPGSRSTCAWSLGCKCQNSKP